MEDPTEPERDREARVKLVPIDACSSGGHGRGRGSTEMLLRPCAKDE